MGRCCYYVSTHRDPPHVVRLLRLLRTLSPDALLLLRHDGRTVRLDPAPLRALDVKILPALGEPTRGRFNLVAGPLLDLLAWLAREEIDYDWLVTMTGQDYVLRPLADYERGLRAGECDAFFRHWDVLAGDGPWRRRKAVQRYWYRYRDLPPSSERWVRLLRPLTRALPGVHLALTFGPQIGLRAARVPWRDGFRCYGGWPWGALHRRAAERVEGYLRERPALVDFYRHTICPEESMVHTVLLNEGLRVRQEEQRYIDYRNARGGHPRTLSSADLPMLAAGGYTLARKFDPDVDAAVFDRIESELLGLRASA